MNLGYEFPPWLSSSICSAKEPLGISGIGYFYGLVVLSVTPPTVLKHWRKLKAHWPQSEAWPHPFSSTTRLPMESDDGSLMPLAVVTRTIYHIKVSLTIYQHIQQNGHNYPLLRRALGWKYPTIGTKHKEIQLRLRCPQYKVWWHLKPGGVERPDHTPSNAINHHCLQTHRISNYVQTQHTVMDHQQSSWVNISTGICIMGYQQSSFWKKQAHKIGSLQLTLWDRWYRDSTKMGISNRQYMVQCASLSSSLCRYSVHLPTEGWTSWVNLVSCW